MLGLGWALLACLACAAEDRYQVLSFIFDSVPPPGEEEDLEIRPPQPIQQGSFGINPGRPTDNVYASIHGPYVNKKCAQCHSNEGMTNRLKVPKPEVCGTCHEARAMFEGKVFHPPTAANQCWGCHEPHQSKNEHLLVEAGPALCLRCHDQKTFVNLDKHRKERGEGCLDCHSPHASDKPFMVR